MFSYYGSKSKIVDYYPPPKYGKIIEPFAGSARYSLKYFDRDVTLIDKYEVVILVWKWLQTCSKNDILNLPKLTTGLDIRTLGLSKEEMMFLSFFAASASGERWIVTKFMDYNHGNQNIYKRVAAELFKIKHWEIKLGCYKDIPNQTATWFIDPPYEVGGENYKESNKNINFSDLAEWCRERDGQTIVCENTKATWLPFKPVVKNQGTANSNTTEAIWSNHVTNYDNVQLKLL